MYDNSRWEWQRFPVGRADLQEVRQHHVHVHVLLLPPAAHEAQVLPAGDRARLQRVLLRLQEGLDGEGELGGVLQHLRAGEGKENARYSGGKGPGRAASTAASPLTRSESRWNAVDR